jgi:hypothetical protein
VDEELLEFAASLAWTRRELRALRAEVARLYEERERAERKRRQEEAAKRGTLFSEESVLAELRQQVGDSGKLTIAAWIVHRLVERPTQSDRIRVGQVPSRLAKQGRVRRVPPKNDHGICLWGLPDAERGAA